MVAVQTPRQWRTMRLYGMVEKQHVLNLVDSGANASFVSSELAAKLQRPLQDTTPTRFVAANGAPLSSLKVLPELQWLCQSHTFS